MFTLFYAMQHISSEGPCCFKMEDKINILVWLKVILEKKGPAHGAYSKYLLRSDP